MADLAVDALITDASERQALVAVRELGRAGVANCAVGSDVRAPAFASRWCNAHAVVPDAASGEDVLVDAILGVCARYRPEVLIPAHDGTIEALRARRTDLERVVRLALAPEKPLAIAIEKTRTLAVAQQLGLRTPRGGRVASADESDSVLDEVGLPAVIKPSRSWAQEPASANGAAGDGKAPGARLRSNVAKTRQEALTMIEEIVAAGIEVLVQEWLPGAREALSFIYAHDRIWARFAQRADRTTPPLGGFSVARESIPLPPDITPGAEQLVSELGLEGYSEVEFRRDAHGAAALMEINPRLSASVEIASRAGVPFALLLYDWASGRPLREIGAYRTGLRMRWLGGDVQWLRNALALQGHPDVPSRSRATGDFVKAFLQPSGYDYLDKGDPGPALRAGFAGVREVRGGFKRRLARPAPRELDTDAVVLGAGPYGLSVSAHLTHRGIAHEVLGDTMNGWSSHMPEGMCLKSEGFASNLSDPGGEHTLRRFCAEHDIEYADIGVPVRLDTFERYGRWFQQRLVPHLKPELADSVRRGPQGFDVRLSSGETLRARQVVIATGMLGYVYVPAELRELPPAVIRHSYYLREPGEWSGQRVAVIGAGQSALEAAALLQEAGADVRLIARRPQISWNPDPAIGPRPLKMRIRYPSSGLGDALDLRIYANHALAIHAAPENFRRQVAFTTLGPAGAWWLRPRVEGKVEYLLGRTLLGARAADGEIHLQLQASNDSEELVVQRVLAGTGYRPNVAELPFLDQATREQIASVAGAPVLTRSFETSVPGLYFVGYAAAVSFGPVMRFVFGTDFTARRLGRRLARRLA